MCNSFVSLQHHPTVYHFLDHVASRWEGLPLTSQSALVDTDDGATIITDTIKEDGEKTEPKSCPQQAVKVRVDIEYLSFYLFSISKYFCLT